MKTPIFAQAKSLFVLFIASTALLTTPAAQAAFSAAYDGSTLTLTQTVDDGAITVDNNGGGDAFRTTDGSGTTTSVAATHLIVNLLDSTGNTLDLDLDNAHSGDVSLNLGDGARDTNFIGTGNSIGGNLLITSGTGAQAIEVGVNANLGVTGSLTFDLGTGLDTVDEDNSDISVGTDWNFTGVNFFENGGTMTVGGNVVVDTTGETEDTLFDDDATMTITGNFTYTGGDGRDEITMNGVAGGTSVGGDAIVNVGDNTTGGVQFIFFNLPNSSVAGSMTVTSTATTNLDNYAEHPSGSIGGNVSVDLGGGPNNAVFAATHGGSTLSYTGGDDIDNVTYGPTTSNHAATLSVGGGDNNLTLINSISGSLTINAGSGVDNVLVAAAPFSVGGALTANLGMGSDNFDENNNDIAVTGDMTFTGVNFFENGGTMTVGGNVVVDTSGETEDTLFDDDATMTITGNFTYTGGDGRDEVTMNGVAGGTSVGGDAIVNVGDNTTGGVQFIFFNLPNSSVAGSMTVTSTATTNLDNYAEHPSGSIGGNVSVDLGGGPNNAVFAATHGGSTLSYTGGDDIDNVTYGPTTSNHAATLSVGGGDNNLTLINSISGSLTINAGSGVDNVLVAAAPFSVGGALTANLGMGSDNFDENNNDIAVTGDMTFTGVNFFENGGTMTVGGNVVVDTSGETEDTLFDDDATMTITGNFTYTGGDGRDEVTMNGVAGGTSVGGDAIVNVGDNTTGGVQFIFFNLPNSSVAGSMTVTSTATANLDSYAEHPSGSIGGNVSVDLGGGPNDAVFAATHSGTTGTYTGGDGVDNVTMSANAPSMNFTVTLAEAVDTFTLNNSTMLTSLMVDFGCNDIDIFNDGFAQVYPFVAEFRNQIGCDTKGTFTVTKDFSDDNPMEVEVQLSCNTGIPLQQTFMISEATQVNFVIESYEPGSMDCWIEEISEGSTGYTTTYLAGAGAGEAQDIYEDDTACFYDAVVGGEFTCELTNELDPAVVIVNKEWFGDLEQIAAAFDPVAEADYQCFDVLTAPDGVPQDVQGSLSFSGDDSDTIDGIYPYFDGTSYCVIQEVMVQDAVEGDDSDCANVPITLGGAASCTITNTVFFEGIPSLNQYGLAIMALLMLGMGMVGVRRFV